jgi:hypothetical protein
MSPPKNLRIGNMTNPEAIRFTRFSHNQFWALYIYFGVKGLLNVGKLMPRISTGFHFRNTPCNYWVYQEEAFLFMMIKVLMG